MMDGTSKGAVLQRHFSDWATDYTVFRFLVVLSVLFSISRAFGSKDIDLFFWRLAYWLTMSVELYVFYGLVGAVIAVITSERFRGNLKYEMIASVIVPVFMSVAGRATLAWYSETAFTQAGVLETFYRFLATMPILVLCANRVRFVVDRLAAIRRRGRKEAQGPAPSWGPSALLARLGPQGQTPAPSDAGAASGTVADPTIEVPLFLEAEDHYVKIVYADRVVINRTTLAAEMAKFEGHGQRVHRSYWVSCKCIAGRAWINRKLHLILKTGQQVPVGRTFEKEILAHVKGDSSIAA